MAEKEPLTLKKRMKKKRLTQENKACHCFHCFPIYLPLNDGTGGHDLSFLNVEF